MLCFLLRNMPPLEEARCLFSPLCKAPQRHLLFSKAGFLVFVEVTPSDQKHK